MNESTAVGWYKLTMVGREYKARGKALENTFEDLRRNHTSQDGVALFLRRDEKADTWEYYFTPEAMAFALEIVKEYAWGREYAWGQACPAPSASLKNLALCRGESGDKYAYLVKESE